LVQRDALDADEVLAAGYVLGDGEFDGLLVFRGVSNGISVESDNVLYAGHVSSPDVRAPLAPGTALISATLNHTFPAPSHVLMSLPSGTRAM
jgi:hypothetical protein